MKRSILMVMGMAWPLVAAADPSADLAKNSVTSGFQDGRIECRRVDSTVAPQCLYKYHQTYLGRPDAAARDAGLYFAAWYISANYSFVAEHAPPGFQQRALAQTLANEKAYWQLYVGARKRAALSDAQVAANAPGLSPKAPEMLQAAADQWGD